MSSKTLDTPSVSLCGRSFKSFHYVLLFKTNSVDPSSDGLCGGEISIPHCFMGITSVAVRLAEPLYKNSWICHVIVCLDAFFFSLAALVFQ